jgi:hypothetical protein
MRRRSRVDGMRTSIGFGDENGVDATVQRYKDDWQRNDNVLRDRGVWVLSLNWAL